MKMDSWKEVCKISIYLTAPDMYMVDSPSKVNMLYLENL